MKIMHHYRLGEDGRWMVSDMTPFFDWFIRLPLKVLNTRNE